MSDSLSNSLSKEKIQQLLAAVGSRGTDETSQIEAAEYNWRQPHCFNIAQLKKLDGFTKKTAEIIARNFSDLYHSSFDVTIVSTSQHFANEIIKHAAVEEQSSYYLAFGKEENRSCGFIGIPDQTAFIWAAQLLGGSGSEKESGEGLSQLEESLLFDVGSFVISALGESDKSLDFQPGPNICKGQLPLELQGTEELCKITFSVTDAGSEGCESYILIPCENLGIVVGKDNSQGAQTKLTAKDCSRMMINHLETVPVSITVKLGSAMFTLEEIATLQSGDILLLDKAVDEPAEVLAKGIVVFYGRPAKSAGRYAVAITEPACHTA